MGFSENLKQIRIKKGFSQKEIAERLGVSQPSYAQYESGKRKPKLETLSKIADALDITIVEFLAELSPIKPDLQLFAGQPDSIVEKGLEVITQLQEGAKDSAELTVSQGRELLESINKLNEEGRQKVKDYADDLAENPKYRKSDTPEE